MGESDNHTFHPSVDNCQTCHAGAEDFDINGAETLMHDAIALIKAELVAREWYEWEYDEETGDSSLHSLASSDSPLMMSGAEYTAFWNYNVLYADHGSIIHNPPYAKAVINNVEELLGLDITVW